jgi:hypothetical protein
MYDEDDTAMYLECYKKLDKNIENIKSLRESQKTKILDAIDKYQDAENIVLIGHHPITGYKLKEEKKEKKKDDSKTKSVSSLKVKDKNEKPEKKSGVYLIQPFPEFVNLWKTIIETSTNKNLYYLCADLHLYQPGTVTINDTKIAQYIVGTGGAKLDANPFTTADPLPTKIEEIEEI